MPRAQALPDTKWPRALRGARQPDVSAGIVEAGGGAKQSPFAKLAALKKTR